MYSVIKNAHISFALFSIGLFVLRAGWSITNSPLLQKKWLKLIPHLNDTLLLCCAIYLMVTTQQYPFYNGWLTAKVLALVLYIILGSYAIRRAETAAARSIFALLSIAVFCYIFAVATTRSAMI